MHAQYGCITVGHFCRVTFVRSMKHKLIPKVTLMLKHGTQINGKQRACCKCRTEFGLPAASETSITGTAYQFWHIERSNANGTKVKPLLHIVLKLFSTKCITSTYRILDLFKQSTYLHSCGHDPQRLMTGAKGRCEHVATETSFLLPVCCYSRLTM
jgi:hypothetical protein